MSTFIYPFDELDNSRVEEVGGKNASLGEMFQQLNSEGIRVPDGFATSSAAYLVFSLTNVLNYAAEMRVDDEKSEVIQALKERKNIARGEQEKRASPWDKKAQKETPS